MAKIYLIEKEEMAETVGNRTRYTFTNTNDKGEKVIVELIHCQTDNSIGRCWKEKKYISEDLKTWISIETYVIDIDGNCWGRYNPQLAFLSNKINFDWVLEDTPANRQKILTEIVKISGIKEG